MCGVMALLDARDAAAVGAMQRALPPRSPDGEGTWSDPQSPVTLGHTRLSIIDLTAAAAQPMTSADGRYVLSFNGEIFNYLELRKELSDYPFRSASDTEVLLAAWQRWGVACLDRL